MTTQLSDSEAEGLIGMLENDARLKSLTNRELVYECLNDLENEFVIEEMMTRLYPRWAREEEDRTDGN